MTAGSRTDVDADRRAAARAVAAAAPRLTPEQAAEVRRILLGRANGTRAA